MLRQIIKIDKEKCNGCGLCCTACHEGAIGMVDGKAQLLRDDYCDGIGDCLPVCPTGAITFQQKDTLAYDEKAVQMNKMKKAENTVCGCAGSAPKTIERTVSENCQCSSIESCLTNWPVQIKLAPLSSPYFDNCDLLIAADCTAFSYGSFHNDFIKNHVTLIGCPKLDSIDYSEKLSEIIRLNNIKSITVTRMTVPCCGGIKNAVLKAVELSGKNISVKVVVISTEGKIVE